jgi:hypothetical protein
MRPNPRPPSMHFQVAGDLYPHTTRCGCGETFRRETMKDAWQAFEDHCKAVHGRRSFVPDAGGIPRVRLRRS